MHEKQLLHQNLFCGKRLLHQKLFTPWKINMDPENDGLVQMIFRISSVGDF